MTEARVHKQDIDFCEMDHENKAWKVRGTEKKNSLTDYSALSYMLREKTGK